LLQPLQAPHHFPPERAARIDCLASKMRRPNSFLGFFQVRVKIAILICTRSVIKASSIHKRNLTGW
ncbi:MAG TPA: hypothetical protein PKE57_08765, partial [Cellvibrionaceae bacterium]|nr:hypothetical protein [Cellvibrionaceae bacterium]